MKLPNALAQAIQMELGPCDPKLLAQAAEALSNRYRGLGVHRGMRSGNFVQSPADRAAYLLTRMPATYAAISAVLLELRERAPERGICSLLDLGAGAGTAMWATTEIFPGLEQVTCVEQDREFIDIGKKLVSAAGTSAPAAAQAARWVQADVLHLPDLEPHDLVVISYVLGELKDFEPFVQLAWKVARKAIVMVEPGTPRGFSNILSVRDALLKLKAHLVAPCPHGRDCPMAPLGLKPGSSKMFSSTTKVVPLPNMTHGTGEAVPLPSVTTVAATPSYARPKGTAEGGRATQSATQDWCHFAQRLERSSMHRRMKSGALGYEDEKFSYVIFTREPLQKAAARIIRHPLIGKGHIKLELCTREGLKCETVTRSDKDAFRRARKARWGEEWIGD